LFLFALVLASVPVFALADTGCRIAIIQHQEFLPYAQAHDAFVSSLQILGKGGDFRIVDDFNAKSDIAALQSKIDELSGRSDLDLIFTIGTHSTRRMIKAEKTKPIVYTIVGDPEHAGIVRDWKSSGANYTGVETPDYYSKVIRLMHHFVSFKSLGMIYLKGSPSHEAGVDQIQKLSRQLGFEFVRTGFPLRDENHISYPRESIRERVQAALETVCPRVEAFFVQTSNTFTMEFDLFRNAFLKHRIVSAGDPTNIENGLVMGIGKDAKRFGRQCAQYAVKILEGTAPAALPMDVGVKLTVDVNLEAAERIGFDIPFELISGADNLFYNIISANKAPAAQESSVP
jgi:ABC-type uncharacterized transport system substrate-binding protein